MLETQKLTNEGQVVEAKRVLWVCHVWLGSCAEATAKEEERRHSFYLRNAFKMQEYKRVIFLNQKCVSIFLSKLYFSRFFRCTRLGENYVGGWALKFTIWNFWDWLLLNRNIHFQAIWVQTIWCSQIHSLITFLHLANDLMQRGWQVNVAEWSFCYGMMRLCSVCWCTI